jgi:membrane protease YdiL (CAAX protease family)
MLSKPDRPSDALTDGSPIAPWWHTILVLMVPMAGSIASAYEHGLPNAHLPGLSLKLSGYVTVLVEESIGLLTVWLWLHYRGRNLQSILGGRWDSLKSFLKDIGLALAFLAVSLPLIGLLAHFVGVSKNIDQASITPTTGAQLIVWVVLAATGGFCEEVVYRGYLMKQFQGWTGSIRWAVLIQGIFFGLAHGFYGFAMVVVVVHGCLLGALAAWRKSLRPGIAAHIFQDLIGGIVAFLL